ncbi:TMV resistance N-like protein [Theobroma cacao]|uniref:TMV resistance N-like protein n=1 Tax=Theobroma cacao TaxID=3641 RepID=A0A061EZ00_THECC|nr:TMV resistance N-like protein [Theobroma cacao]
MSATKGCASSANPDSLVFFFNGCFNGPPPGVLLANSRCTYDVFLSFRRVDTCKNFADHLYMTLVHVGIHTFRDDDEIERGEKRRDEIERAIYESKISIIIFLKNYTSSTWSLNELVKIMEHRKFSKHIVLPIFYDVNPSQVKEQTGSFAEAFARHEESFKSDMDTVQRWRAALREVADLGGMLLEDRYESHFIQDIIKQIQNKLHRTTFYAPPYLVGIDFLVTCINWWFGDGQIRFLLVVNEKNKLMMHQMIRDMGRNITRQESPNLAKRSRLWQKDAFDALREKIGTKIIKCLTIDLQRLLKEKYGKTITNKKNPLPMSNEVDIEIDAFANMQRLELVQLDYVKLKRDYKDFPKSLIWLSWYGFAQEYLPTNLDISKLVVLEMCNSSLKRVWNDSKVFHEGLITSCFVFESGVPISFEHRCKGSKIYFSLAQNPCEKVSWLNLCIEYSFISNDIFEFPPSVYIVNETKELMWAYVLYDCGIISIYDKYSSPEDRCGGSHHVVGNKVSLVVVRSSGQHIGYLNLVAILFAGDDKIFDFLSHIEIVNKTKDTKWIHHKRFIGISKAKNNIYWFNLWRFLDEFEDGDQVSFTIFFNLCVKSCGINLKYEPDDDLLHKRNFSYQQLPVKSLDKLE